MKVAVTSGAIRRAKLAPVKSSPPTYHHPNIFTGRMSLSPTNSEGRKNIAVYCFHVTGRKAGGSETEAWEPSLPNFNHLSVQNWFSFWCETRFWQAKSWVSVFMSHNYHIHHHLCRYGGWACWLVYNVEDQLDDDWSSIGGGSHRWVNDWNEFLVQLIHTVVRQSYSTTAHLVADLYQPATHWWDSFMQLKLMSMSSSAAVVLTMANN